MKAVLKHKDFIIKAHKRAENECLFSKLEDVENLIIF
jgi:hypothetical protein